MCEYASDFLCGLLTSLGYQCTWVLGDFKKHRNGKGHCWIIIKDTIPVDLTVYQFGEYDNGIIEEEFYSQNYKVKEYFPGENIEIDEMQYEETEAFIEELKEEGILPKEFVSKSIKTTDISI